MSLLFGYLASALIGISLGLIGGGGSILTVPVLVYLFGIRPGNATAYSLFIVGVTAAVGAADYWRRGEVDFRTAAAFALPSVAGVYLMRRLVIPALPTVLARFGGVELTKDRAILLLFAVMMLAASVAMIRKRRFEPETGSAHPARLAGQGFATGLVTGAVGAGGGFLIVPALAVVAKMPMRRAVATSLLVIAINSLSGFVGDLQTGHPIAWATVLTVSAIALAGLFVRAYVGCFVSGPKLKPAFGVFVLVMGTFVIGSQFLGR